MHRLFHGYNLLFLGIIFVNHNFLQTVISIFAPLE